MESQQSSNVIIRILGFFRNLWLKTAVVIGSLVMIAIVLVITYSISQSSSSESRHSQKVITKGGNDKIAIVSIEGEIIETVDNSNPLVSPSLQTPTEIQSIFNEIKNDNSIKGVVLKINSPGGGVVASDEIYNQVLSLKALKPVVASLGDTAASGGYYVASGATKIVANRATITGSIGVIAEFPKLTGLYNKIGIDIRTYKSGPYKDIGSLSRESTDNENQIIQSIIDGAYNQFVTAVAKGRNISEDKVRTLADGRIYSGEQAQANGLVDQLGSFQDSIASVSTLANVNNPTIIEYDKGGFLSSFIYSRLATFGFLSLFSNGFTSNPAPSVKYLLQF